MAVKCYCDICGHLWFVRKNKLPTRCPECQTRRWNEGMMFNEAKPKVGRF